MRGATSGGFRMGVSGENIVPMRSKKDAAESEVVANTITGGTEGGDVAGPDAGDEGEETDVSVEADDGAPTEEVGAVGREYDEVFRGLFS